MMDNTATSSYQNSPSIAAPNQNVVPPTSKFAKEDTPITQHSELLYEPQLRFPSDRKWTDKFFALLFVIHLVVLVAISFAGGNARERVLLERAQTVQFAQTTTSTMTTSDSNSSYDTEASGVEPSYGSSSAEPPSHRKGHCLTNESSEVVFIQIAFIVLLSMIFSVSFLKLIKKQPQWFNLFLESSVLTCLLASILFFAASRVASEFLVFAIILLVAVVIQIISIIAFRKRIAFATQVLQTAASLLLDIPSTVRLAYITLAIQSIWAFLWVWALRNALFLEPGYLLVTFLLFSLYWTSQVIKCVLHTTCSGSFASWYFVAPEPFDNAYTSLKRTMTSSFGSVCFGSMVTSIIGVLNCILPLCICDIIARYFNRYAFVQVATYGKTYCQSAKSTISLFRLHGFEAIANDDLTILVMFGACATFANLAIIFTYLLSVLIHLEPEEQVFLLLLTFAIVIVMIATTLEVLDSAVVTLFVCFVEQPERLKATKPEFYELFRSSYANNCALFESAPSEQEQQKSETA